jgi:hypothetical protein
MKVCVKGIKMSDLEYGYVTFDFFNPVGVFNMAANNNGKIKTGHILISSSKP